MKILIQKVKSAAVTVEDKTVGAIGEGLLLFVGVTQGDTQKNADAMAEKIVNLRLFPSEKSYFDVSAGDAKKALLIVSQFTLYGACDKGRRPDFSNAAKPEVAEPLYNYFVQKMRETALEVATGQFQAHMEVSLVNDGPVTFMLEN